MTISPPNILLFIALCIRWDNKGDREGSTRSHLGWLWQMHLGTNMENDRNGNTNLYIAKLDSSDGETVGVESGIERGMEPWGNSTGSGWGTSEWVLGCLISTDRSSRSVVKRGDEVKLEVFWRWGWCGGLVTVSAETINSLTCFSRILPSKFPTSESSSF